MITDLQDKLLSNKNKEIIYYASAVALYRLKLLLSNGSLDGKYAIYKWHILMILPFDIWNCTGKTVLNYWTRA